MYDVQKLIGEVARRNKIRVEPDDPAFALVTLNQLVLEETSRELEDRLRQSIADFAASVQKVETRAGRVIAQEINDRVAGIRNALESDITRAGAKAADLVYKVHQAHTRPSLVRWALVGLFPTLALFGSGLWIGAHYLHGIL